MSKRLPLSDQIRQAVKQSGLSQYALCKLTGIDKAAMSRFVNGDRGLSLATLDRLADVLGLEVVAQPAKRKGTRPKKGG
ncbi:hypothetical protein JCM19992_34880 [Thermostilla marina]